MRRDYCPASGSYGLALRRTIRAARCSSADEPALGGQDANFALFPLPRNLSGGRLATFWA